MTKYYIEWMIDVEATSPREAAEEALRIQRNPESIATVFSINRTQDDDDGTTYCQKKIDLSEMGGE